ncbi:MAG: BMP family ABC transporter substrate-binding protein [Proteobacteria bacterium]|nr:BMP family ABC transporter substrate-binding protein [Pseudomonadota bacterium]
MATKPFVKIFFVITLFFLFISGSPALSAQPDQTFTFGLLLVGPMNDHGWSQAHFEAGKYVEEHLKSSKMLYIDKVNPADRPGITIPQLADDMIEKGARLIIANSDDMSDGIIEAATMHPDIYFIHVSGDGALTGKAPKNLSNVMGRMEYGKMMAGFAAAMTTKTGKIAYLGPLINDETRRLTVSCYLGARYAWEHVLKRKPSELQFEVSWIGFWFNIPGVTSDPTQVTGSFFNSGYDVVISGIDTSEASIVANQKRMAKKDVYAIPYDYKNACDGASAVCLGVPYYNWGPSYVDLISQTMKGNLKQQWLWLSPNWQDINNPDTSHVGFIKGPALSDIASKALDLFISDMGTGKIQLFKGPLNYQDGSVFLAPDEVANDKKIWYMEQLLSGMKGQSRVQ